MSAGALTSALREKRLLLLDGAMGTELQRRGVSMQLPLWSARALAEHPEFVLDIHRNFVEAGADIVTTNTFRTTGRTCRAAGLPDESASLTARAVGLARTACKFSPHGTVLVAGSIAPLEDCYRPDLVPPDDRLETEHAELAGRLAACGVDLIILETFGTLREAAAACRAAVATGLEVIVSFLCRPDGTLYGGERLDRAVRQIEGLGPAALSINCVSPRHADPLLRTLRASTSLPCAIYGNVGMPGEERSEVLRLDVDARAYALHAAQWIRLGASIIGGCCGTTPAYIRELRRLIDAEAPGSGVSR